MSQTADKAEQSKQIDTAGDNDDKVSTSSSYKRLTSSLRQLEAKRRTYRRTLQQYERIKAKFTDLIAKQKAIGGGKETAGNEKDGAANTDPEKQRVIAAYRLLRNYCISYNTVYQAKKEEDRQEIPEKFTKEIETVLGNKAILEQFKKALKAESVEDSVKQLPDSINEAAVKGLLDFINKHDQAEIIAVLNQELNEMTAEIDKMRTEQKTRKSTIKKEKVALEKTQQQKQVKKPKKIAGGEDQGKTTEQRFRDLIKEVQQRVSQIKLEKDDYRTYSEVQSEVDNFLNEATTEIMAIKNGLRKRFENIQSGKGEQKQRAQANKQQKQRKARAPRKANDDGDNQQNSVFSKANPIQD